MDQDPSLHVACLCAAWCGTCDDYRPAFEQVEAELRNAGASAAWHWIDIEDEADLVGDFDIETFPTIVVCDAQQVRFAGPVTPQPVALSRLLRALLLDAAPDARWPAVPAEAEGFARRLRLS
ncbi:MAG TPA: thioredoxin family protein [Rubrivivax sp.]|nr:thioredoxin family protein [Rubrivivax sp.]